MFIKEYSVLANSQIKTEEVLPEVKKKEIAEQPSQKEKTKKEEKNTSNSFLGAEYINFLGIVIACIGLLIYLFHDIP